MKNVRNLGVTLATVLIAFSLAGQAQTSRGAVTGTVTDQSGAVVGGAKVTLTNPATNASRDTVTNSSGVYRFEAVDLGVHRAGAEAAGFSKAVVTGVNVSANLTTNVDFALKVGSGGESIVVESNLEDVSQITAPVRGGNFQTRSIAELPLQGLDSLNLMLLVPGVQNARTTGFSNGSNNYSVNGQRARGNNFMIDGVENNDISVAGPAYQITNTDAIQEVSVQTSNFSAEFGRAGGAVVNQITKSGTNKLHGTLSHYYLASRLNALSRSNKIAGIKRVPQFVENIPAFSIGGPVYIPKLYDGRNKTFFFGAGQWDRFFATARSGNLRVPTDAGVATLQALAATCPNVALYLQVIGTLRGSPASVPSNISIAVPNGALSCTGTTRAGQVVQTGLVSRDAVQQALDNNHQIRIDHTVSDKQTMSFRWLYDRSNSAPAFNNYPGFDRGFTGLTLTGAFADTYVINNHWTNEFRFNYGRIGFNFPALAPDAFHNDLPSYAITGLTGFGIATNIPQFRYANNWQYQDSMTYVSGNHTFRFGVDFLRQLAKQRPPFNERGSFSFAASTGATALANFIDNFGGTSGQLNRNFGNPVYYPNLLRQSYFFQDTWKANTQLTLTLGLRYENFGQPANVFKIPAFTNYDPVNFAAPNKVNRDNNNFGPTIGFAWSPQFSSGPLGFLFGESKSVWRGGYQVTYDTFFNNLLSNIAGSSPNTLGGNITSAVTTANPRGTPNWSGQFATITATPATALSPQTSLLDPNIRNPYVQHYSLGWQRELPQHMVMDVSYVGTLGRKLFQTFDMNPFVSPGVRFQPAVGQRTMRASSANSSYDSLQTSLRRRFSPTVIGQLQVEGSYTWSHAIDNTSEVFATDSTASAFQSLPQVLGFSSDIDRANSDNDRRHRFVLNYVWDIRGPKSGVLGQVLGGWALSGIWQLESGVPFTISNGIDRNRDGQAAPDRPDISNRNAPITSRAIIVPTATCATGYQNPDSVTCVAPTDVYWIQGTGLPNANTARRNSMNSLTFERIDLNIKKSFKLSENWRLEYRSEIINLFNSRNFLVPGRTVNGTTAGSFLNYGVIGGSGSANRSIKMQLKLRF